LALIAMLSIPLFFPQHNRGASSTSSAGKRLNRFRNMKLARHGPAFPHEQFFSDHTGFHGSSSWPAARRTNPETSRIFVRFSFTGTP